MTNEAQMREHLKAVMPCDQQLTETIMRFIAETETNPTLLDKEHLKRSISDAAWMFGECARSCGKQEGYNRARSLATEQMKPLVEAVKTWSNQLTIWFSAMNEGQSPKNRAALVAAWENTLQALANLEQGETK